MNKSESIKELAAALNKAQAEMSGAKKKATNPFFKSKYSDMNAVVDAVRVPFCDNGLSYSQFPLFENGCVGVETILMHESGEWISSVLMLPMVKQDPQAAGSAITYARRYSLQSIAGIPSEDDDGNSAVNRNAETWSPERFELVKKLHMYASDKHTPMELYGFIKSVKDESLNQWLCNQFEKGLKTAGVKKIGEGRNQYFDYVEILKSEDESAIAEAMEELTEIELAMINKINN